MMTKKACSDNTEREELEWLEVAENPSQKMNSKMDDDKESLSATGVDFQAKIIDSTEREELY